MTGLRLVAADTSLDSAGRARKRDSVLRVYRLTPTALESAASRLASKPQHAVELLRAIDQSVAKAGSKVAPNLGQPASPGAPTTRAPATPAIPATKKPSI